ncbi:hypothetical protein VKT23_013597 [Stygiomarasmius scandens]|uniref:Protein kinase domain-containing protein n=1 Tax=Marasmiellus scandens TaxID=2682957 RepID=A0ABR1J5G5_9AGAR
MDHPLNSPVDRKNIDPKTLNEQIAFLASSKGPEELSPLERYWRDHKTWLEERGYLLRPRYHPGWTPSWKNTSKIPDDCEDGQTAKEEQHLMDARRISDGAIVMLKRISIKNNPRELAMARLLHSEPYRSDPRNHCIPIHEILSLPDEEEAVLLVMPFLYGWRVEPKLETVGETVEFLRQIFEGLKFLHDHNIAHNDVKTDNIMMDPSPLYNQPLHPVRTGKTYNWTRRPSPNTRTQSPVKYYIIDFDLARSYDRSESQVAIEYPRYGGDATVPEFMSRPQEACDPFAVDIYRLGNLVRKNLSGGGSVPLNPTFRFLHKLISDMTQDDPNKRPSMDEAVNRFESAVKGLGFLKLRSRVAHPNETLLARAVNFSTHWPRQIKYILQRKSAIPKA